MCKCPDFAPTNLAINATGAKVDDFDGSGSIIEDPLHPAPNGSVHVAPDELELSTCSGRVDAKWAC